VRAGIAPRRAKIARVNSSRFVWLATICAAIMCCAGTMQLLGINRIVVDDGRIDASTSPPAVTTLGAAADIHFGTDTFRLDP
jgi:hypothetical protein